MRSSLRASALLAVLLSPALVAAQDNAPPPAWLSIGREIVKPGKESAHGKSEIAWSRALEAAKPPVGGLAMSSMSGPLEIWWMSGYASAAEMEKMNATSGASAALSAVEAKYRPLEADFVNTTTSMLARYRADLSYITGAPMPSMRYMLVTRLTIKPGHVSEYVAARQLVKAAHEQTKPGDGFAIYEVVAGAPSGTFIQMAAKRTLAELDTNPHGPAYVAALGGADGQKKLADMQAAFTNTSDVTLFKLDPQLSFAMQDWATADSFWKPKPVKVAAKP